ncbi:MAG: hypothetical protein QXI16_00190 [Sulfolobaceae archaeon]
MEEFAEKIIIAVVVIAIAMSVFGVVLSSVQSAYNSTNTTLFPNVGSLELIIPLVVIAGIIVAVIFAFFRRG